MPPKSHYRICLPPLLAPTITGWIPHGARQRVSKGALSGYLEGDWKEARLSKERNCTAKPAQQSADNPVRELKSTIALLSYPKSRGSAWHSYVPTNQSLDAGCPGKRWSLGQGGSFQQRLICGKSSVLTRRSGPCRTGFMKMMLTSFSELRGTRMGKAFKKRKCLDKNKLLVLP